MPQVGGVAARVINLATLVQSEKASLPMLLTLVPKEKDLRLEHPEKAQSPIEVTPSPICTFCRFVQPKNSFSGINSAISVITTERKVVLPSNGESLLDTLRLINMESRGQSLKI